MPVWSSPSPGTPSQLLLLYFCFKYVPDNCIRYPLLLVGLRQTRFCRPFLYLLSNPFSKQETLILPLPIWKPLPSSSHTGHLLVIATAITPLVPVRTACTCCLYSLTVKEQIHDQQFKKQLHFIAAASLLRKQAHCTSKYNTTNMRWPQAIQSRSGYVHVQGNEVFGLSQSLTVNILGLNE